MYVLYVHTNNYAQIALCCVLLGVGNGPLYSIPSRLLNSLRPRRNRRHFADDIIKCILLCENVLISIKISLKFIPKGPINNIPALVQIMAWRRTGDKPLSEPMMIISLTHICDTRPRLVNSLPAGRCGNNSKSEIFKLIFRIDILSNCTQENATEPLWW